MKSVWFIFYNLIIFPILFIASSILSLFNLKIKKGLAGKKRSLTIIKEYSNKIACDSKCVLFHCASLGEYEQIKPILKYLTKYDSNIRKVVTFFSPSGYENMGENPDVDLKIYLPIDSLRSLTILLNQLKPVLFVISKHDIWPNLVWSLYNRKIPAFLINGTMPADSHMTKPIIRNFYHSVFSCFSLIAPANEKDKTEFYKIVKNDVTMEVLGDTRYDQVLIRSQESKKKDFLPRAFFNEKLVFVAGSIWPSDEEHLFPAFLKLLQIFPNLYLILVPHEPEKPHIIQIKSFFDEENFSSCKFSEGDFQNNLHLNRILIVDRIGILANLYSYGSIAYVGGSFGPGVHNVMEPAAFHIPVLFGPKILNSPEALELVRREAGFRVETSKEVYETVKRLCENEEARKFSGEKSASLVEENRGATEKIVNKILNLCKDL